MTPPAFTGTVDLRPGLAPRSQIRLIVFDFDGTLSWIRHGWPDMMRGVMARAAADALPEASRPTEAELLDIVLGMNGRPSIVQMTRCADLIAERGGPRPEPTDLLREYAGTLDAAIARRADEVRTGRAADDAYVVFGARALLEHLAARDFVLYVLSTTAQDRVRHEAELLGLTRYFGSGGERIIGGTGDPAKFSKKAEMERMLAETGLTGDRLLSFGDGPAEARAAKELGGLAVAVCSDEAVNGSGVLHPFKRRQIMDAGADAAVPDYRDAVALADWLTGRRKEEG